MQEEIWKDIPGLEGKYQVSNFGNVKSLPRLRKSKGDCLALIQGKLLTPKVNDSGYLTVHLRSDEINKYPTIHRLVAEVFIPNTENKKTVNHIDGNKLNNNLSNLEWSTHAEQMQHASQHNLLEVRGAPKFSKEFKKEIYEYYQENKVSIKKLAEIFEVSERTAGRIANEGVKARTTKRILKTGEVITENILTKQQVSEIKELRTKGMTYEAIGKLYNRSISQIARIVKDQSRTTEIE